ncbi:hypothetical protein ACFQJ7_17415 [Halovenus rubra]|uniref:DUF7837 domain-containing protein n=3 Tax=Halovenus rubra TaxID=869890 RepID=A0ABD5X9A7_9EURY|nr:hypothetical protein [Halovenus rubra]
MSDVGLTYVFEDTNHSKLREAVIRTVMTADNTILGRCPDCNEPISETEMVIDYYSERGNRITTATCPSCVAVVTVV